MFSSIQLFATTRAPQSVGFSRQESWSGLPFPPPGNLPDPGIKPTCPASPSLQTDSFPLSHQESPYPISQGGSIGFWGHACQLYILAIYQESKAPLNASRLWRGLTPQIREPEFPNSCRRIQPGNARRWTLHGTGQGRQETGDKFSLQSCLGLPVPRNSYCIWPSWRILWLSHDALSSVLWSSG